jgi:hypothetical protein
MQTKWYDYGVKIRMRKVAREYGVLHAAQMLHDAGCPMEVALHFLARHPEPKVLRFARNHEAMHQMLLAEQLDTVQAATQRVARRIWWDEAAKYAVNVR